MPPLHRTPPNALFLAALLSALLATPALAAEGPPPEAYAAFCMGIDKLNSGEHAAAVAWLERALTLHPRSTLACLHLGETYSNELDNPTRGDEYFRRALEHFPGSFRARCGLAKNLLRAGDTEPATTQLLEALELPDALEHPTAAAQACSDLAAAAEAAGDWRAAIGYYDRAAKLARNPVYTLVRLAYLYRATGQHEKTLETFREIARLVPGYAKIHREACDTCQTLGRWAEALEELDIYINHPGGPGPQNHLLREAAMLAARSGQLDVARQYHERLLAALIQLFETSPSGPDLAEEIASALVTLGRLPEAEVYLRKAVDAAEGLNQARLRSRLAAVYRQLGRLDDAIEQLNECIRSVDPKAGILYRTELSAALEAAGKHEEARRALEDILLIPGAEAAGHGALARFLARRGETDAAVAELRLALQVATPGQDIAYRVRLSSVYSNAGRYDEAEAVLLEARKLHPDAPIIDNALGWLYAVQGVRLDEALTLVQSALKAQPQNPYYLDSLGWIYFQQGDKEGALEHLLKAATLVPDAVIWEHVGDVYMSLGDAEKAGYHWRRSLDFNPGLTNVRRKLENLDATD